MVTGGHHYPSGPGKLAPQYRCPHTATLLPRPLVGVALSAGTAAKQRPPSEQGVQNVIDEVTAREQSA